MNTVLAALLFIGCDDSAPPPSPAAAPEAHGDAHGEAKGEAHGDAHGGHSTGADPANLTVPEGAKVSFISPADGATVSSPVKVEMGVEGMTVQPAGAPKSGTGHHHIIVDGRGLDAGVTVPADETHIHYGAGQTETELTLAPGTHTLTLQFANGLHQSYGPQMSTTITVTVQE